MRVLVRVLCVERQAVLYGMMVLVGDLYEQRGSGKCEVGDGRIPFLLWAAWLIAGVRGTVQTQQLPGIE